MTKEHAIQILRGEVLGTNEQTHEAVFMAIKALKNEKKRGRWLLHEYPDGYYHTECSECGKVYSENVYFLRKPNYCPHCGAQMERSEE